MTIASRRTSERFPLLVGGVALVLASIYASSVLADADWDATVFVGFGADALEIRAYAEERLGAVQLRPELGHDGRFFFVQANDPWLRDPENNAHILDRPRYRSQRMLYPALAGGLGFFGSEAIVWAMLLINLAAMGVGSWAVAEIAVTMGGSAWWGLAFLLNLGFISEMSVGGAGVVAGAAAFGAVVLLMRSHTAGGLVLLTVAALSREVMLAVAAGAALYTWKQGARRRAIAIAVVPLSAVVAWALYVRFRIAAGAGLSGLSEVQEIGLPFAGFIQAFEAWISRPIDLIVGVAVFLILGLSLRRAILHDNLLGWAFLGFVPISIALTEQVWHSYFDISRAVAPLITAFVLLAALGDRSKSRDTSSIGSAELV